MAKANVQIHFNLTSNNCKSPREEPGIFTVNSVPELQALSKSVKAMNLSSSCSSLVEACQDKKFYMHSGIKEMPPMGFILLKNKRNSSLFLAVKAHAFPSSLRFLRKLLNLSM